MSSTPLRRMRCRAARPVAVCTSGAARAIPWSATASWVTPTHLHPPLASGSVDRPWRTIGSTTMPSMGSQPERSPMGIM
ncbi:MAG: flavin reductase [Flavobacteriales bacterium]|nr:flavin reductase [Flavobacteriales bacterium]